jgi:hypothetical protein
MEQMRDDLAESAVPTRWENSVPRRFRSATVTEGEEQPWTR